jgi:hypothetical protein
MAKEIKVGRENIYEVEFDLVNDNGHVINDPADRPCETLNVAAFNFDAAVATARSAAGTLRIGAVNRHLELRACRQVLSGVIYSVGEASC